LKLTRLKPAVVVGTDMLFGLILSVVGGGLHVAAGHDDCSVLSKLVIGGLLGCVYRLYAIVDFAGPAAAHGTLGLVGVIGRTALLEGIVPVIDFHAHTNPPDGTTDRGDLGMQASAERVKALPIAESKLARSDFHGENKPRVRVGIDIEGNVFLAHEFLDEMRENW
jgi:hypothetical protein